jgi:hypothetical protein
MLPRYASLFERKHMMDGELEKQHGLSEYGVDVVTDYKAYLARIFILEALLYGHLPLDFAHITSIKKIRPILQATCRAKGLITTGQVNILLNRLGVPTPPNHLTSEDVKVRQLMHDPEKFIERFKAAIKTHMGKKQEKKDDDDDDDE